MPKIDIENTITTREFAASTGMHVDSAKRLCASGKILAEKIGGRFGVWMIPKAELNRYQKKRSQ